MPKIKYLVNNNISVELFVEDNKQFVFIADENSSGCKYEVKSFEDIGKRVAEYLQDNWKYL